MITANEELLSPEQVGERLGVSVYTVRRWIKDGRLRAFKPGKEYRIQVRDLEEFLRAREVRPKPLPRSPYEPSLLNGLEEERRGGWDTAVHNARQLREHGQTRAEELLALWRESKEREEDAAERRAYLDEMGELLQQAYDARPTLFEAMSYERLADQWPELQTADEFYRELWHLVQGAGLSIRTGNAQEERPKAVEESEAA